MVSTVANPSYSPIPHPSKPFKTFSEFYPFYLGEHSNKLNRLFHLLGTSTFLAFGLRALVGIVSGLSPFRNAATRFQLESWRTVLTMGGTEAIQTLLMGIGGAYFLAWLGHFGIEKNRPATFKYPLFSLRGDFRMLWEVITLCRSA